MWTCPDCGEVMDDQFEGDCWKCANEGTEVIYGTVDVDRSVSGVLLSTTPFAPGRNIEKSLGIVNDVVAVDAAGTFENQIKNAHEVAIARMTQKAKAKGANGIVGIRLNYQVIPETVVMVTVYGTLVKLSPS